MLIYPPDDIQNAQIEWHNKQIDKRLPFTVRIIVGSDKIVDPIRFFIAILAFAYIIIPPQLFYGCSKLYIVV